jgi:hypothetical protein
MENSNGELSNFGVIVIIILSLIGVFLAPIIIPIISAIGAIILLAMILNLVINGD